MRQVILCFMWGFIFGVLYIDVCYAFQNEHSFAEWEFNPVAVKIYKVFGFSATIGVRIGTVLVAFLLCALSKSVRMWATSIIFLIHLVLLMLYVDMLA